MRALWWTLPLWLALVLCLLPFAAGAAQVLPPAAERGFARLGPLPQGARVGSVAIVGTQAELTVLVASGPPLRLVLRSRGATGNLAPCRYFSLEGDAAAWRTQPLVLAALRDQLDTAFATDPWLTTGGNRQAARSPPHHRSPDRPLGRREEPLAIQQGWVVGPAVAVAWSVALLCLTLGTLVWLARRSAGSPRN